jgi:hypothetical protein
MQEREPRFDLHQRVRVTERSSSLFKETGTVVRLRHTDRVGYVQMDAPPPPELRAFPDDPTRARWVALWPEQCGPVRADRKAVR